MISRTIRTALQSQLSDVATGLNPRIAALAGSYGSDPYVIDWSNTSVNFIYGQVDPEAIEESSAFTLPMVTIDTVSAQDLGLIFSATFSGVVVGIIDIHHSWPNESVLSDFSSLVDLSEEAVIACLKDPAHQHWSDFGNMLLRKGGLSSTRGKVKFGLENWMQSLRVVAQFELAV